MRNRGVREVRGVCVVITEVYMDGILRNCIAESQRAHPCARQPCTHHASALAPLAETRHHGTPCGHSRAHRDGEQMSSMPPRPRACLSNSLNCAPASCPGRLVQESSSSDRVRGVMSQPVLPPACCLCAWCPTSDEHGCCDRATPDRTV